MKESVHQYINTKLSSNYYCLICPLINLQLDISKGFWVIELMLSGMSVESKEEVWDQQEVSMHVVDSNPKTKTKQNPIKSSVDRHRIDRIGHFTITTSLSLFVFSMLSEIILINKDKWIKRIWKTTSKWRGVLKTVSLGNWWADYGKTQYCTYFGQALVNSIWNSVFDHFVSLSFSITN